MKHYEDRSHFFSVGVGAMIVNAENKVLLVRKSGKKTWSFPGGSLSVEEDVTKGLNRELKEELGLGPKFFEIEGIIGIRHRFNPKHGNNIFVIFSLRYGNPSPKVHIADKEEIAESRWFLFNNVIKNSKVDLIVKEVFKKYASEKRYLLREVETEFKPDDSKFYKLFL